MAQTLATDTDTSAVARVRGEAYTDYPRDLYIPPDALEVFLETFEGPLDLLLYLIRRQNLDIRDVPIAEITRQYMEYVEVMHELRFELAAEYLAMAAVLCEIKSRLLLPRPPAAAEAEADPRAELIRQLQEYERFKVAAEALDALPRMDRELQVASAEPPTRTQAPPPDVTLQELLAALGNVLQRAEHYNHHHVQRESLSVRERMTELLGVLATREFQEFNNLFRAEEGRLGIVVGVIAILELLREGLIELVQAEPFATIYLRATTLTYGEAPAS